MNESTTIPLDEQWRVIPGFGNRYEASNLGRIRRVPGIAKRGDWRPPIVPLYASSCGYLRAGLLFEGKVKQFGVHQLIALTFLGPCPEGFEVDHIDMNKTNNRLDNLEYVTHRENHRRGRLLKKWGFTGTRLFTPEQIRTIRTSSATQKALADEYGVSQVAICHIRSGKTYREVE